MIDSFVHTALAAALLVSTHANPPSNSSSATLQEQAFLAKKTQNIWVVKPGDTLSSIAKTYYGNENYWKTIWNDNPEIIDMETLEVGYMIAIRPTVPNTPDDLSEELQKKLISLGYGFTQGVATASESSVTSNISPITYTGGPLTEEQITYLGTCEAGMNPARNSGNGYYGAFQFSIGTWNSMNTGYERADLAPIEVQKDAVQRLLSRSSIFTQFPGCARKMQANGLL